MLSHADLHFMFAQNWGADAFSCQNVNSTVKVLHLFMEILTDGTKLFQSYGLLLLSRLHCVSD